MSRKKSPDSGQVEEEAQQVEQGAAQSEQDKQPEDEVTVAHTLEAEETRTIEPPKSGVLVADEEGNTEVKPEEEAGESDPTKDRGDLGVQASSEQLSTVLTGGLQGGTGDDAATTNVLGELSTARQAALTASTRAVEFKANQGGDPSAINDAQQQLSEAFDALEEAVRGE
ncbi:MAG: hypothetical protein K0S42_118 [Microvirga sp.]|nr:hypothetical protein [Microvirga sp.]